MYAEQDVNMLIGECTLDLQTYVTPKDKDNLLQTPSAAASVGIILGVGAMAGLMCLYCYCCSSKRTKDTSEEKKEESDEVSTFFKRLEDEKSTASGKTLSSKKGLFFGGKSSVVSELA